MTRTTPWLAAAALTIASLLAPTASATAAGVEAAPDGAIEVDAGNALRPINRGLLGIHTREGDYSDLRPTTHRHVISAANFLHYDCASGAVDQASVDYFDDWLDAVDAEGADAILSLSYVPECIARDGQSKGPSTDPVVYRAFLDDLLTVLVTDRASAGTRPLEYLELWNEPDIPLLPDDPSTGHGWVGTIDEYFDTLFPHLAAAILQAEADSGVDIRVGTPASYSPWSMRHYAPDLTSLFVDINGFDRATAGVLAATADATLSLPQTGATASQRIMGNGGFEWPRRAIAEGAAEGLEFDFVSVHLYPNNPLQGAPPIGTPEPVLLQGRNPQASPDQYGELADTWSAEFPGQELFLTEWSLSAGSEWRHGTCEGAAFDASALSVMQDSPIDRGLFLGRPSGAATAARNGFQSLPDTQVAASLPTGTDDLWVTAAASTDRTTLLVSQWHSKLADAVDLTVPLNVDGLADGEYQVTVEWIGEGQRGVPGRRELTATADGGTLTLDDAVPLPGQSVARVDLRRPGADPLPPLSTGASTNPDAPCLPGDGPSEPPVDAPAARPVSAAPAFTG